MGYGVGRKESVVLVKDGVGAMKRKNEWMRGRALSEGRYY